MYVGAEGVCSDLCMVVSTLNTTRCLTSTNVVVEALAKYVVCSMFLWYNVQHRSKPFVIGAFGDRLCLVGEHCNYEDGIRLLHWWPLNTLPRWDGVLPWRFSWCWSIYSLPQSWLVLPFIRWRPEQHQGF